MRFEPPFDAMDFLAALTALVVSLPPWLLGLLAVGVAARILWPWAFAEREMPPRRRRRRWRRRWHEE